MTQTYKKTNFIVFSHSQQLNSSSYHNYTQPQWQFKMKTENPQFKTKQTYPKEENEITGVGEVCHCQVCCYWSWKREWDFHPWWTNQVQRKQFQQEWQFPKRESTIYYTVWWRTSIDLSGLRYRELPFLVGWYGSCFVNIWLMHDLRLKKVEEGFSDCSRSCWKWKWRQWFFAFSIIHLQITIITLSKDLK